MTMNTGQIQVQHLIYIDPHIIITGKIKFHGNIIRQTGQTLYRLRKIHLHAHAKEEILCLVIVNGVYLLQFFFRKGPGNTGCGKVGTDCFYTAPIFGTVLFVHLHHKCFQISAQGFVSRLQIPIGCLFCFFCRSRRNDSEVIPVNLTGLGGLCINLAERQEVSKGIHHVIRRQQCIIYNKLIAGRIKLRKIAAAVKAVFPCSLVITEQPIQPVTVLPCSISTITE